MKVFENTFHISRIQLPNEVQIEFSDNFLSLQGPLGKLSMDLQKIDPFGQVFLSFHPKTQELEIFVKKISNQSKAFFGSFLALLKNNIYGIQQGYLIHLEIVGIGYRAILHEKKYSEIFQTKTKKTLRGLPSQYDKDDLNKMESNHQSIRQVLELKIGQTHDLYYLIPENMKCFSLKPTLFSLYGIDKQQVTQIAAEIQQLKYPEAYKGKGIRLKDQIVRIKEGKKK